jgi:hypothetical protein
MGNKKIRRERGSARRTNFRISFDSSLLEGRETDVLFIPVYFA